MIARRLLRALLAATALLSASSVMALTCGQATDPTRLFTLDPAALCVTGQGNPLAADVLAEYPSTAWAKLGDITVSGDNSAWLDISVTSGAFGSSAVAGTWALSAAFWQSYGDAVITMHSGNGTPEHASFLLNDLAAGGTFAYSNAQRGGGFSNFILWGRGPAICGPNSTVPGCGPGDTDTDTDVPEPGTLALLGLGLMGLGASRRRKA